jgi:3-dehydroquinate synthase
MTDNICFSNNPAEDLNRFLAQKRYSKLTVLVDENTKKHCYPLVETSVRGAKLIEVQSGEEYKTLKTCETIWASMTDQQLDRHAAMVVLGGGVRTNGE